MTEWQDLFKQPSDIWLTALPAYQRKLATTLLSSGTSPDVAAERWLSAAPTDTHPFGTIPSPRPYLDKLLDELEAFLCGDPKYESDRLKLAAESKPTQAFVVAAISVSIAPKIGTSAPLVAPVIVLLIMTAGKLGLNAWCAIRKESRVQRQSTAPQGTQDLGNP
jgi:hypothetical protein